MACRGPAVTSPPDSSSGVSDLQQSVGSSPGLDTCVLEQTMIALSFGWDVKAHRECSHYYALYKYILLLLLLFIWMLKQKMLLTNFLRSGLQNN